MDRFFNEWVYGTGMPHYDFKHSFTKTSDGTISLTVDLTQSGVDDSFIMPVPIYLEMADGKVMPLGSLLMKGAANTSQQIPLAGVKETPRRAMINYNHDILSDD